MARSLSKNLISPSVFMTKPNDALATLDVYTKNNGQIVNKIQDIARMFDVDSTNLMKGGAIISKHFPVITKLTDSYGQTLKVNTENLVARISSISKNVSSSISQLSDSFGKTISELPLTQQVYSVVDGIKSRVGNVDLSGLKPIVSTIQEVVGDRDLMQLVDLDAETALYVGLISEASNNGIANSFKSVVGSLNDPYVRNSVIRNALPYAVNTSDVRMLQSIIEGDFSRNSLLDNTSLITDFSRRYKSGYGYGENEDNVEFNDLYNTYYQIHPEWNKKTLVIDDNEEEVFDISKITDSSAEFKQSLLNYFKNKDQANEDELFMTLATVFEKTTVDEELKKMLPMLVLHEAFNQF